MIIKETDDKAPQIAALEALLVRPDATPGIRKDIKEEIRFIQAGFKTERDAAYEMKIHFGSGKNWAIIHDLRLEHESGVAQIDHLMLNRLMDFWVCETKSVFDGLEINEHGEFSRIYYKKTQGIPSPVEQNNKHILILERILKTGAVKLPTRLGFTLNPELKSLILISAKARISRPKKPFPGLESIVKIDQVRSMIDKDFDNPAKILQATKMIGTDTLEALARSIAALHKPIQFNWAAKFGLSEIPPPAASPGKTHNTKDTPASTAALAESNAKPKQKLICHKCNSPVPYNVARFCWFNKPKFGGNVYCMECQKTV